MPRPAEGRVVPADRERVLDILAAVGDAVALASPMDRPNEAVELVEHLLAVYTFLDVERYQRTLQVSDVELMAKLKRVRLLAAGFRDPRFETKAKAGDDPAAKVDTAPIMPAAGSR